MSGVCRQIGTKQAIYQTHLSVYQRDFQSCRRLFLRVCYAVMKLVGAEC